MRVRAAVVVTASVTGLTLPAVPGAGAASPASAITPKSPDPRFALAPGLDASPVEPVADADSVVVRFARRTSAAEERRALERRGVGRARPVHGSPFSVVATNGRPLEEVLRDLSGDAAVEAVVPNYVRTAFGPPDDPLYKVQRSYLDLVRVEGAWSLAGHGAGGTIAILDSGIDATHPDLAARILPGADFVGGSGTPHPHGTMVASVAAAATGNGEGIAGVAGEAAILPVRVLHGNTGTDANVAAGITWAADNGADVVNLSLGGPGDSPLLRAAVDYALARGVVVVAAAGNSGTATPMYPAAYPGVIAVAATEWSGALTWFSSRGEWVDIAAPGLRLATATCCFGSSDPYDRWATGTSFAAPIVSGVALLVRRQHPAWPPARIAARLRAAARDGGPRGPDPFYGAGVVDAAASVGGARRPASEPARGDRFEPNDTLERARTFVGQTTATIAPEGDVDWLAVDISTPGSVEFKVKSEDRVFTAIDPVLAVYGPDRNLLAERDISGGAEETIRVPVSRPGKYFLRVSSYYGARSDSHYTVSAFLKRGPAPLFHASSPHAEPWNAKSVAVGDVSGAPGNELLVTSRLDFRLFVYPQLPDGFLGRPQTLPTHGTCQGSICHASEQLGLAVGDLDGDGRDDAAVATSAGIDLYHRRDGRLVGPTLVAPGVQAHQVEIADLDGDGDVDLVAGRHVLWAEGGGYATQELPRAGDEIETGDVNGDGRLDVVLVVDGRAPKIITLLQGPDRDFVPHELPFETNWLEGIAVGDVTGDARDDVVVTQRSVSAGSYVNVLRQLPSGELAAPVSYRALDSAEAVEIADVDGDRREDVVAVYGGERTVGVFRQRANGTLARQELVAADFAGSPAPKGLAIGDLNRDGRPDLAIASGVRHVAVLRRQSRAWLPRIWVRRTVPAEGAARVRRKAVARVTFGRALRPASVSRRTLVLRNVRTGARVPVKVTYNRRTRTAAVAPRRPLAARATYELTVRGVRAPNGMVLPEPHAYRFSTGVRADRRPPDTFLRSAPIGTVGVPDLFFVPYSDESGSTYECRLDAERWSPCGDRGWERRYAGVGAHVFRVRAVDPAGNRDPTPVVRRWRLDGSARPPNDYFDRAETLTGPSGSVDGSTAGAGGQNGEPFHAHVGGDSVWYRWTAPATGTARFETDAAFDTVLALYADDDTKLGIHRLRPVAANDDAPGRRTSTVAAEVEGGETYWIAVAGLSDALMYTDNGPYTLTWNLAPP